MKRTYYIALNHPQRGKGYYTTEAESFHDAQQIAKDRFSDKATNIKTHPYRDSIPEDYRHQLGSLASGTPDEARYAR